MIDTYAVICKKSIMNQLFILFIFLRMSCAAGYLSLVSRWASRQQMWPILVAWEIQILCSWSSPSRVNVLKMSRGGPEQRSIFRNLDRRRRRRWGPWNRDEFLSNSRRPGRVESAANPSSSMTWRRGWGQCGTRTYSCSDSRCWRSPSDPPGCFPQWSKTKTCWTSKLSDGPSSEYCMSASIKPMHT